VPPEIQLIGYIRLLAEHGVQYAIVGGVGGRIQGAATSTQDIDIMPEPSPENLRRLATALSGIDTNKKEAGSTEYEPHDEIDPMEFRTADVVSFETRYGAIDVLMELPGVGTYDAVMAHARKYEWQGIVVTTASLDDIITSKETADRAKDWRAMDALYEARDCLRTRPDDYELSDNDLDVESTKRDPAGS
jgi:hypothetical protein